MAELGRKRLKLRDILLESRDVDRNGGSGRFICETNGDGDRSSSQDLSDSPLDLRFQAMQIVRHAGDTLEEAAVDRADLDAVAAPTLNRLRSTKAGH